MFSHILRSPSWLLRGAVLAVLPLAACSQATKTADMATADVKAVAQAQTNPTLSTSDALFIDQAGRAGLAEVAEGQVAAQQARRASVRALGARMVKDHGMANDDLAALAARKQIAAPAAPSDSQQADLATLKGLKGTAFDRQYLNAQVADHRTVLKLFQTEAQQGTDADVKAFAAQYAPVIAHHLDMFEKAGGHAPMS
jgi:putative membrane protein